MTLDIQKFYDGLDLLFREHKVDQIKVYMDKWLKLAEMEKASEEMIAVYNERGGYCRAVGDLVEAEDMYLRVMDILEKIDQTETENYATAMINLGVVYIAWKNDRKALEMLLHAKKILEDCGFQDDYRMAALNNNLSMAYRNLGESKLAEKSLQKAFHILKLYSYCKAELATTLVNLGELQIVINKLDEAEISFLAAIDIFENDLKGADVHYSSACSGMGELSYLKGDFNMAVIYYEKALQLIDRDFGKTPFYDLVLKNLNKVKSELA